MTKEKIAVGFSGLILVSAALAWQVASVKLPAPDPSSSIDNKPRVIPRPEGAQLHLPKGFAVEEYATDFKRPRFMVLGPNNEILLSETLSDGKGSVYVLTDKAKSMKSPERKTLIQSLDRPYGLAFWKDYLYVAETTSLKRYKYDAAAMSVGAGEEVVSMKGLDKGHQTRTVLFDRKGEKMYLTVGSGSNVATGEDPRRAAINRYNPDGSGHEIYASGTRNPVGLRWYPGTDTLWTSVEERDLLGDDLVPDYLTHIQQGGFYGWPYAYFGPNEDPRNKGQRTDLVSKTITPDVALGAHVAVLDFIFYTGTQFPSEYRNGAFLAFHGSWNRKERVGYSIAFLPFKNGKPSGALKEFMGGWMMGPDKREVWGRPVGVLQLPDGSLLVTDDGANKIWRISHNGK